MRKCAQCGKDIPTGNSSCNYCGYNPSEINKKGSYSFGKAGSTPNPNGNSSKIGKIILIIFLVTFFGPFILGIILMIVFGILFANGVFDEETNSCNTYCSGEYQYIGDHCYCSNGEVYDEYGSPLYDFEFGDIDFDDVPQNIHLFETNTLNLDRYVNNNETAVVVVCSDFNPSCNEYAIRMIEVARAEGFNLFMYKYELLNQNEQDKLMSYFLGVYDESKPLTFIMSDGKMQSYHEEDMGRSEIKRYLVNNGIM